MVCDARLGEKMQGRARMRKSGGGGGGEIVEVEGGHIVRSTGRKDRHSKVCTAKGPRDRRVRLAAHTAIQFYDVQDRLGYDRPSKAVDWLINKAKAAIDDLAHLPPWHPTSAPNNDKIDGEEERRREFGADLVADDRGNNNSSFLPPSLDSDAIADTIKSFFPAGAAAAEQFHAFSPPDLLPRSGAGGGSSQDLRLSLQSFHDFHQQHQHNEQPEPHQNQIHQTQVLINGGLDGWPEHHHFQRLAAWNSSGGDAYLFNLPQQQQQQQQQPMLQQLLGQNQFVSSQRGPLQSSNTPSIRAWIDPSAIAMADHNHHHHPSASSISGIGFASGGGGFTGFHIPARIQGDKEEHDGYSDKPSSASSDSRH